MRTAFCFLFPPSTVLRLREAGQKRGAHSLISHAQKVRFQSATLARSGELQSFLFQVPTELGKRPTILRWRPSQRFSFVSLPGLERFAFGLLGLVWRFRLNLLVWTSQTFSSNRVGVCSSEALECTSHRSASPLGFRKGNYVKEANVLSVRGIREFNTERRGVAFR